MSNEHFEIQPLLGEYIDGELDDARLARVQEHLDRCAECLGEVDGMLELQAGARALPREIAPSRDLWPEIAARLQQSARPPHGMAPAPQGTGRVIEGDFQSRSRRSGWRQRGWVAAAAVVLVAISSGTTAYLLRSTGPAQVAVNTPPAPANSAEPAGPAVDAPARVAAAPGQAAIPADAPAAAPARAEAASTPMGLAAFGASEQEYRRTVDGLHAELQARRERLSPETVAIIEKNLRIIDAAILEARAALEADPSNAELPLMLSGVYRTKVELLQRAVQLSART